MTVSVIYLLEVLGDLMEEWRDVKGYEGFYRVSNKGQILSIRNGIVLKQNLKRNGYLQIEFSVNGVKTTKSVHRVVAESFLDNPGNLPCVNHKDECKTNNDVSNLEFCTQQYNLNYGNCPLHKYTPIIQMDKEGNVVKVWNSIKDACRNTTMNYQCISACCRGIKKQCYGYKWKYLDSSDRSGI